MDKKKRRKKKNKSALAIYLFIFTLCSLSRCLCINTTKRVQMNKFACVHHGERGICRASNKERDTHSHEEQTSAIILCFFLLLLRPAAACVCVVRNFLALCPCVHLIWYRVKVHRIQYEQADCLKRENDERSKHEE